MGDSIAALKIVWRFNLQSQIDETAFFAWLRDYVWGSSARWGCSTQAFRLEGGTHAYATEATWPSTEARDAWQASDDRAVIANFPGTDSLWAAQVDLERVIARELA